MSASPVSKDQTGSFPEYFTFAYRTFSCWFVRNILLFMFLFSYFHFTSSFLAQMLLRGSSSVVIYEHISMYWFLFLLCSDCFLWSNDLFSLCSAHRQISDQEIHQRVRRHRWELCLFSQGERLCSHAPTDRNHYSVSALWIFIHASPLSLVLSESVYSRVDRIDGQEICFNIWDSQYAQVGLHLAAPRTHTGVFPAL